MLIGEYKHNIDSKKRMAIPAKFRKEMGERVVITRGLDKCLFIYTVSEWERVAEKLSGLPTGSASNRDFARSLLAGASDVEIDSLGRVLIPDYLKNFAGLGDKVVIAGVYKRLEVWDEKTWNEYKSKAEKQMDVLAEKLGEMGMY